MVLVATIDRGPPPGPFPHPAVALTTGRAAQRRKAPASAPRPAPRAEPAANESPQPVELFDLAGVVFDDRTTYRVTSYEHRTTSEEDGGFLALKMLGQPRLTVFKAGYGGMVFPGVPPGARDIALRLPPGAAVSGEVLDEQGRPAPDVPIYWLPEAPDNVSWKGETRTDDRGRFAITRLPAPGRHWLYVEGVAHAQVASAHALRRKHDEDRQPSLRSVAVEPGEVITGLVLEREPLAAREAEKARAAETSGAPPRPSRPSRQEVRVAGTVRDALGRPLPFAGVRVEITSETGGRHEGNRFTSPARTADSPTSMTCDREPMTSASGCHTGTGPWSGSTAGR